MSTPPGETVDLFVALSAPERRAEAAARLAAHVGAQACLLFVRDPVLPALIPAPGMPQTLRGGASWRNLLRRALAPGRHSERVEMPLGDVREALCIVADGVAAIFLGGTFEEERVGMVERLLPLLSRALAAEQSARFATEAAAAALGAASQARALADALEAARAEHARLNARLRDEHQRKDDFLAMLAHELRNPLTPLVTSIELVRRAAGQAHAKQLEIMARQVRQLSRLVEDLLDVSRVSRGRIELRRHRLRLGDVLSDAVEACRPLIESRSHRLEVHIPPEPIEVHADNVRLTQVFSNLLHNAAKYTDAGGHIRVELGRQGGEAVVRVSDNGMGIDPATFENVFDLFVQAPVSLDRAQGGLGIGLTLVRALVELHGGRVQAHSDGVGRGSTFTVRLRAMTPDDASHSAPPSQPLQADAKLALRVLVVDDNEDAANSLAEVLRLMGHQAEVAYSGLETIQLASDVDPDLVLLDIGLPEIDGYEVARRLRNSAHGRVRLVAVTGYGAEADRRRSREAGFDEHVVKPVMPETLAGILSRARAGQRVAT